MQKSWDEISHWDGYDYVLVNDDLTETEARLKTIITAERLRASQQPDLVPHVNHLFPTRVSNGANFGALVPVLVTTSQ